MQVIPVRDGFILPIFNVAQTILNAAEHYVELGYSVIPVYGDAGPDRAKVAAVAWTEFQQRKPTPIEIRQWFAKQQYPGLAIVTGSISNLVVLDFDSESIFSAFAQQLPHLVQTPTVKTRRGCHLYFRLPSHLSVPSRKGQGVDLQSDGRYVVAPPTSINGHAYRVVRHDEPRTLTQDDISRIQAFLDAPATVTPARHAAPQIEASMGVFEGIAKNPRASSSRFLASGELIRLYRYLAGHCGRNEALFRVSLRARDDRWTLPDVLNCLVDIHAQQPARSHHGSETYEQRCREAICTVQSAYSRPARPRQRREGFNNAQLPNSVREKLLELKQTYTIRVIEGLRLAGVQPGQTFTTAQALELLRRQVGRDSVYHALAATTPENLAIFQTVSPSQHPQKPANADTNTNKKQPTKCKVGRAQKSGKSKSHRPARVFVMPGNLELCQKLGVKLSLSDPVSSDDLYSAKKTRQALHRELIKRRPGIYPRRWLAGRLGVCIRTLQTYNQEIPIHSLPMYMDTLISWRSLNQIPDFEVAGTFLRDETGKKYPPRRDIAMRLLRQGHFVIYRRQDANYWYFGESPPDMEVRLGLRPNWQVWEAKQAQVQEFVRQQERQAQQRFEVWQRDSLDQKRQANSNQLPTTFVGNIPTSARAPQATWLCENLTKSELGQPAAQPLPRHNYREPFADPQMERLAQQLYVETNPNGLSICNARRLIATYGAEVVDKVLKRALQMQKQGKVSNLAGFLVTASRIEWRVQHGATALGAPAPRFRGEPNRAARSFKNLP